MFRIHLLIASLVSVCTPAYAQTVEDFLFSDSVVTVSYPKDALKSYWLEDPEFRVEPETDAQSRSSQQYKLRVKPTSRRTRSHRSNLDRSSSTLSKLQDRGHQNDWMQHRYQQLISLAEAEVVAALQLERLNLAEKQVEDAREQSSSPQFGIDNLYETTLSLKKEQAKSFQTNSERDFLRRSVVGDIYQVSSREEPMLSTHLTDVATIKQWLHDLDPAKAISLSQLQIAETKVRIAQSELALEKSETSFALEFLEFSFSDDRTNAYAVTFGFRLPFARSTMARRQKTQALASIKLFRARSEQLLSEKLRFEKSDLHRKIAAYELAIDSNSDISEQLLEVTSVRTFVSLRRFQLDTLGQLAQLHTSILAGHLGLLHRMGKLSSQRTNLLQGQPR